MSNSPDRERSTTRPTQSTAASDRTSPRPAHLPSAIQFNEAIQNLASSTSDDELRGGEPTVGKLGLPQPYSGGFADIYRVHCPATGNTWAVKCFTRGASGLGQRYAAISQHLKTVNLPFMVEFDYIDQGVRIDGVWYPIVKMRWIEGPNLNAFVAQSLDQPVTLDRLFRLWVRLSKRLRQAGIAHADLQHGNVIVTQHQGTDRLHLCLIDYDGMYVPALAGQRSGEVGHPAFQHPQRLRDGTYHASVDRFSHLAICCAIRALRVGGRSLWGRFDNGDNLLFREQDFVAPLESELFQELFKLQDPVVQVLAGRLALAALARLDQTPAIDELVNDEWLNQLSNYEPSQRQTLLEPSRDPVSVIPVPPPIAAEATQIAESQRQTEFVPETAPTRRFDAWDFKYGCGGVTLFFVIFPLFFFAVVLAGTLYPRSQDRGFFQLFLILNTISFGLNVWSLFLIVVESILNYDLNNNDNLLVRIGFIIVAPIYVLLSAALFWFAGFDPLALIIVFFVGPLIGAKLLSGFDSFINHQLKRKEERIRKAR